MATVPPARPVQPLAEPREKREIRIVSHSNLFYWWPLWLVGFILGLLTLSDGTYLAVVPTGTRAVRNATVKGEQEYQNVDVLVLPEKQRLLPKGPDLQPEIPHMYMSANKSYGVMFTIVLLLLIVVTNVPLRGLWSFIAIGAVLFFSLLFAYLNMWESILETFMRLHIHINAAGYLLIAGSLLVVWLLIFFLFDTQIYMLFTPGQLRVRQSIGGGEVVYDTAGMSIQKQRNDLFRHGILGLGSGDLIVNTSGAASHHLELPNVLFVGHKVRQIEDMLREKAVVAGR
jgi:hypothetical protein